MKRRTFLNLAIVSGLAGTASALLYPVLRYLLPPEEAEAEPETVKAGPEKDFAPGSSKILKFGRKPVIVIRDLAGGFHALSATCTHLDCIVQYRKDRDLVWCACHNGNYDLSGKNVSGPPPRPLDRFEVKLVGSEVTVLRAA
ncbi:MAG: Rieske 2Fe-2S domain-containing protein [Elusimicrobia bacterium]|nr:Rieske 2Fe-2S domain-containing protein [Elusimicrobiota bacterium]